MATDAAPRGIWVDTAFAEQYDLTFARQVAPIVARALLALAAPTPASLVLEAACGTGAFTLPLAQALGPAGRLVSSDQAAAMLRVAARKSPLPRSAQTAFVLQDLLALASRPETFDLVACNLGMHVVSDPARACRELGRVLRPGGRLAFSVPGDWSLEPFWTYFWERCRGPDAMAALRQAGPAWTPDHIAAALDRDRLQWRQHVERAGFEQVVTSVDSDIAWFSSAEDFLAGNPFGHIGRARDMFSDRDVGECVFRDIEARLRADASAHGVPMQVTVLSVLAYRPPVEGAGIPRRAERGPARPSREA